MMIHPSKV
ncbi:hypothetical protein YPPY13_0919, partial [Yersinia pestis PY-13]